LLAPREVEAFGGGATAGATGSAAGEEEEVEEEEEAASPGEGQRQRLRGCCQVEPDKAVGSGEAFAPRW
jgi:hypothetical protein